MSKQRIDNKQNIHIHATARELQMWAGKPEIKTKKDLEESRTVGSRILGRMLLHRAGLSLDLVLLPLHSHALAKRR